MFDESDDANKEIRTHINVKQKCKILTGFWVRSDNNQFTNSEKT